MLQYNSLQDPDVVPIFTVLKTILTFVTSNFAPKNILYLVNLNISIQPFLIFWFSWNELQYFVMTMMGQKALRKMEFSELFVFASFGIVRLPKFRNFLEISGLSEFVLFRTFQKLRKNYVKIEFRKSQIPTQIPTKHLSSSLECRALMGQFHWRITNSVLSEENYLMNFIL